MLVAVERKLVQPRLQARAVAARAGQGKVVANLPVERREFAADAAALLRVVVTPPAGFGIAPQDQGDDDAPG